MSKVTEVLDIIHVPSEQVDYQGHNTAELILHLLQRYHWATCIDFSCFALGAVIWKLKVKQNHQTPSGKALESTSAEESCTCPPHVHASGLAWPLHLPIHASMHSSCWASAAAFGQLLLLKKHPSEVQDIQHRCHRRSQSPFFAISSIPMGSCRFRTFSVPTEPYPSLHCTFMSHCTGPS